MVLGFAADNAEGIVVKVLIDLDLGNAVGASGRQPFLVDVVIDHH